MSENKPSPNTDAFIVIVILVRVFVVLALWLGMFLVIFFGVFTVPFILMTLITAVYLISDLGLFATLKRRGITKSERQKFIEAIKDDSTQKE